MAAKWACRWREPSARAETGVTVVYCDTKKEARGTFRRIFPGRVLIKIYPLI